MKNTLKLRSIPKNKPSTYSKSIPNNQHSAVSCSNCHMGFPSLCIHNRGRTTNNLHSYASFDSGWLWLDWHTDICFG